MKTVSIIVPHYNGSHLISTLLDSIPQVPWLQIIVVDDHSSEEHYKALKILLNDYSNARLYQVPKGQKGPGMARNIGIARANTDWLLFADADDYYTKDAFGIINEWVDCEGDVVFFPHTSINATTNELSHRHNHYKKLIDEYLKTSDKTLFYQFYSPCSKLIRKELIHDYDVLFDSGVGGEDNVFSLKLSFYAKNVEADARPIYCIVDSCSSLTSSYSDQVLINHFNAMSRFNDFLQQHQQPEKQAWMLGWIIKGRQISLYNSLKWLMICLKKRYPVNPFLYFK